MGDRNQGNTKPRYAGTPETQDVLQRDNADGSLFTTVVRCSRLAESIVSYNWHWYAVLSGCDLMFLPLMQSNAPEQLLYAATQAQGHEGYCLPALLLALCQPTSKPLLHQSWNLH